MKNREELDNLEKIIGQLQALHTEIGLLSKKSAIDAVNDTPALYVGIECANDRARTLRYDVARSCVQWTDSTAGRTGTFAATGGTVGIQSCDVPHPIACCAN